MPALRRAVEQAPGVFGTLQREEQPSCSINRVCRINPQRLEPFAGGARVRIDAAAEHATSTALNVAASSFEVGYSTLGIRAASLIPVGDGMVLIPRATAAWQYAFDSVTPLAALAFQNSGVPFAVAGVPIARDRLLAEAGLDLAIGRNATLGVSYVGHSKFVATKVLRLDDTRLTPAERHNDGLDYVPTNKYVVFGHHFAAIAGAGPLVGPAAFRTAKAAFAANCERVHRE
jgi:hypothetical protein